MTPNKPGPDDLADWTTADNTINVKLWLQGLKNMHASYNLGRITRSVCDEDESECPSRSQT